MTPRATKQKNRPGRAEARDGPITLEYQLVELPSSQHRAGLAGLVQMIGWLHGQPGERQGVCELTRLDESGAAIALDRAGLRELFDVTYGASEEEEARPRPFKNKNKEEVPPLRVEERTLTDDKGKAKRETRYIYPVVVPRGAFLAALDPAASGGNGPWIKLWRDMVWSILRGVPATREPFEARAERRPTRDADEVWSGLVQGADDAVDLPSTYFLGAQAITAENVRFKDRARWQMLLHFWPFVAQVYVPEVIDPHKGQREFLGYAIALPDVSRLATFCEELPSVLRARESEMSGYRPRGCVVELAAESALDVGRRLADRLRQLEGDKDTSDLVLGFDVFHMEKQGNNIRMLSRSRVEPDAAAVDRYRTVRNALWSPIFRKQCLVNLLADKPWWSGFDRLFETWPHQTMTFGSEYFRHDAREAFKMNEQAKQDQRPIERVVYEVVRRYVLGKVEAKLGFAWETAKGVPEKESSYSKAKEKTAKEAFLAVRSRTGADFVDYFASSLCSVPQRFGADDMLELARALRARPDEIRTMTLLALSAWG